MLTTFCGLALEYDPVEVMTPLPYTKILVALADQHTPGSGNMLDVGTGSGNIALAVKNIRPGVTVRGVDFSPAAVACAAANAKRNELDVEFSVSNVLDSVTGGVDVIVAHLPYIDNRLTGSHRNGPPSALYSHNKGLAANEKLIRQAPAHLNSGGVLILMHLRAQTADIQSLLETHGFRDVQTHTTLSEHDRATVGIKV